MRPLFAAPWRSRRASTRGPPRRGRRCVQRLALAQLLLGSSAVPAVAIWSTARHTRAVPRGDTTTLPDALAPHPLVALGAEAAARHGVLHRQLQVDDRVGRRQAAVRRLSGCCAAGLTGGRPQPTLASQGALMRQQHPAASSGIQLHHDILKSVVCLIRLTPRGSCMLGSRDGTLRAQAQATRQHHRPPGLLPHPQAHHPAIADALAVTTMQSTCARLTRRLKSTDLGPPGPPPATWNSPQTRAQQP